MPPPAETGKKGGGGRPRRCSSKPYRVARSGIEGRGLFATADLPAGTLLLEYRGEKITKAESARRSEAAKASARRRGRRPRLYLFALNARYDLDGAIPGNPAKYINHSCEANCDVVPRRGHLWVQASRDVRAGEELTVDYGYPLSEYFENPCACGTPACPGYIVAAPLRWKLRARRSASRLAPSRLHYGTPPTPEKRSCHEAE